MSFPTLIIPWCCDSMFSVMPWTATHRWLFSWLKHFVQEVHHLKSGFQAAAGSKLLLYSVSWWLRRLSLVKNNCAYLHCGLQGTLNIKAFVAGSTKGAALMSFKITLECNKNQSSCKARSAPWIDPKLRTPKCISGKKISSPKVSHWLFPISNYSSLALS